MKKWTKLVTALTTVLVMSACGEVKETHSASPNAASRTVSSSRSSLHGESNCPKFSNTPGVDYSVFHVVTTCQKISQPYIYSGVSTPYNSRTKISYGSKVTQNQLQEVYNHEMMHHMAFFATGQNEDRLDAVFKAPKRLVDLRTNVWEGTTMNTAWLNNPTEGIAQGWATCHGAHRQLDMGYVPSSCVKLEQVVKQIAATVKAGETITYLPAATAGRGTELTAFAYTVNLPVGKTYSVTVELMDSKGAMVAVSEPQQQVVAKGLNGVVVNLVVPSWISSGHYFAKTVVRDVAGTLVLDGQPSQNSSVVIH